MIERRARTDDPRELPAYTISEAAHYLSLPAATIRYWSVGRDGHAPLIAAPEGSPTLLSFLNLAELHVLAAIRRTHEVKMRSIREAIRYLAEHAKRRADKRHPLIGRDLESDGLDLFSERYGELVNIGRAGQTAMRDVMSAALRRIDRDPGGIPIKLYPFTRPALDDAPSIVVIDPSLSAGRPVIAGTGLATQVIAERYKAGESVQALAEDYGLKDAEIDAAIRCELLIAA
ncbi:MAG: DUF433 domain-containing protein [Defluviicoccus sp.]|nr:DUF433 domain-containing protein [Defluviicoccus sp.]MDE0383871.1 DUF433 domain-containing protein [Defluviicoccus sp.]